MLVPHEDAACIGLHATFDPELARKAPSASF